MSQVHYAVDVYKHILQLNGHIENELHSALQQSFEWILQASQIEQVIIDMRQTRIIDSIGLGLLAAFALELHKKHGLIACIYSNGYGKTKSIFDALYLDSLFRWEFKFNNHVSAEAKGFRVLPLQEVESDICKRSLRAHKTLIQAHAANEAEFSSIVASLEFEVALLKSPEVMLGPSLSQTQPRSLDCHEAATQARTPMSRLH